MNDFIDRALSAQIKQADAMIEKHKVNVEILTKNAVGVAEHPDIMATIEKELERIAYWTDIKNAASIFDYRQQKTLVE